MRAVTARVLEAQACLQEVFVRLQPHAGDESTSWPEALKYWSLNLRTPFDVVVAAAFEGLWLQASSGVP
jgi:hypothetical protein